MLATSKTVIDVAIENGYSKHTFYRVIKNESPSAAVRILISDIIKKPVNEIWPDKIKEQS